MRGGGGDDEPVSNLREVLGGDSGDKSRHFRAFHGWFAYNVQWAAPWSRGTFVDHLTCMDGTPKVESGNLFLSSADGAKTGYAQDPEGIVSSGSCLWFSVNPGDRELPNFARVDRLEAEVDVDGGAGAEDEGELRAAISSFNGEPGRPCGGAGRGN